MNTRHEHKIHWKSIWLIARSHMTSHYSWGPVTTLHDFGSVSGRRPWDAFFWALTISWSQCLARVWKGPLESQPTRESTLGKQSVVAGHPGSLVESTLERCFYSATTCQNDTESQIITTFFIHQSKIRSQLQLRTYGDVRFLHVRAHKAYKGRRAWPRGLHILHTYVNNVYPSVFDCSGIVFWRYLISGI